MMILRAAGAGGRYLRHAHPHIPVGRKGEGEIEYVDRMYAAFFLFIDVLYIKLLMQNCIHLGLKK